MRRAKVEDVPVGTRVLYRGLWHVVGEQVHGLYRLTPVEPGHCSWLWPDARVSVDLPSQAVRHV